MIYTGKRPVVAGRQYRCAPNFVRGLPRRTSQMWRSWRRNAVHFSLAGSFVVVLSPGQNRDPSRDPYPAPCLDKSRHGISLGM